MNSASTYRINHKKAISETLDGETIIINLETGTYYSMNPSGTALWNAIAAGQAIPVDDPTILNFIEFLKSDGLIEESAIAGTTVADTAQFVNPHAEKYTDMQEMLLADPIHDVDDAGWPNLKKD